MANYKDVIENAARAVLDEIEELKALYHRLTGGSTKKKIKGQIKAKVKSAKKRIRRSSADVIKVAEAIAAHVKSKGKDGAAGAEITKKFGKVLPSIKQFVNKRSAVKIKTSGKSSKTRYHAA